MQRSMARRTTPHSTPHDAAARNCGPKTALAWREEGERRRGQEPDSTCVTDLRMWLAKKSEQVGETRTDEFVTTHLYTNLCESSRKADQHRNRRHVRAFPASSPCRIAVPVTPQSHSILSSCPSQALGCFPSWDRTSVARVKPHSIAMALPLCTAVATAPRR